MVVVDLKMPDMDDFEFLAFMNQNYPHIPVIVTTAFGTPDIESKIKKLESCLYFEKPVDMELLKEKIFDEMNIGVGGQIHGIGLSSFLQMSEMEKTTCTLRIKADEKIGLLYLLKGELIAAEKTVEEIRDFIGLDSLGYLHADNLVKATHIPREDLCLACFDGEYPVPIDGDFNKYCLE